jgi:hypothetical protein
MASEHVAFDKGPRRPAILILIGLLVVIRVFALVYLLGSSAGTSGRYFLLADVRRYQELAAAHGTPYRDFQVEVPPVGLEVVDLVTGATVRETAVRLGWSQLVVDLAVAAVLLVGWGTLASLSYLVVGTVLAPFIYFRIDLVSVLMATGAVALIAHRRERSGGLLLAAAAFAKIWPLALIPVLLAKGRHRAVASCAAGVAAGLTAWIIWAGTGGLRQVVTFRGARGWQIESVVGAVVRLASSGKPALEAGAWRIGTVPLLAEVGLIGATILSLIFVGWFASSRRQVNPFNQAGFEGLPALAAVSLVLVLSPLLSMQYLSWLFPWVAIAAAQGEHGLERLVLLASFLSMAAILQFDRLVQGAWWAQGLVLARNAALILVVVACVWRLVTDSSTRPFERTRTRDDPSERGATPGRAG